MIDELYYVRWRGQVKGPYGLEQLKTMVAHSELSKLHEISSDRVSWHRAGTVTELYPKLQLRAAQEPTSVEAAPEADYAQQVGETRAIDAVEAEWYYSRGETTEGPYTTSVISDMISQGQLTWDDYVCPAANPSSWQHIRDVPDFAGTAGAGLSATPSQLAYSPYAVQAGPAVSGQGERSYAGMALFSLILGIVGILIPLAGIPGLILGLVARKGMDRTGNRDGEKDALAGIVLGFIDTALLLVEVILLIVFWDVVFPHAVPAWGM